MTSVVQSIMCDGKAKHASYIQAHQAINRKGQRVRTEARSKKTTVTPYRCKYCTFWHIGKAKKNK